MSEAAKPRPEFRNINIFKDVPTYRMPLAAIVSILHRVSGALIFMLLPLVIWLFDKSLTSEHSFRQFTSAFSAGLWIFPGWLVKLAALALIWAYLHHLIAGVRHLYMDATHCLAKEFGKSTAAATLALSLALTAILGAKLFGLY
ncbi:MAG: succinate dehydrogenase, cytochrome b556 subunit [Desulfovibrionaceae bacterium]|nr:succinate dehydrogenase, cytochrome b556 subunit [Desulfovibrionaceae bacterium]